MSDLLKNSIIDIINNYKDFFLNKSNVNGIGLGYKKTKDMFTNELCLGVFVDNKIPENKLYKHELIPNKFLGIKTDIVQVANATFLNSSNTNDKQILRSYKRPLQPGYAIRTGLEGLGTLGAIVFDEKKQPYILSNNHVLSATNKKTFGTAISQPPYDEHGFAYLDKIVGYLYKQVIINIGADDNSNFIDCAIAKILPDVPYTTEIYKIGKIKGVRDAKLGMEVKKVGATTGFTTSVIRYTNASIHIQMDKNEKSTLFNESIICDGMSKGGDSGSLVLDNDNYAVGLLFAGTSNKDKDAIDTDTILNSIESVLEYLKVDF